MQCHRCSITEKVHSRTLAKLQDHFIKSCYDFRSIPSFEFCRSLVSNHVTILQLLNDYGYSLLSSLLCPKISSTVCLQLVMGNRARIRFFYRYLQLFCSNHFTREFKFAVSKEAFACFCMKSVNKPSKI